MNDNVENYNKQLKILDNLYYNTSIVYKEEYDNNAIIISKININNIVNINTIDNANNDTYDVLSIIIYTDNNIFIKNLNYNEMKELINKSGFDNNFKHYFSTFAMAFSNKNEGKVVCICNSLNVYDLEIYQPISKDIKLKSTIVIESSIFELFNIKSDEKKLLYSNYLSRILLIEINKKFIDNQNVLEIRSKELNSLKDVHNNQFNIEKTAKNNHINNNNENNQKVKLKKRKFISDLVNPNLKKRKINNKITFKADSLSEDYNDNDN